MPSQKDSDFQDIRTVRGKTDAPLFTKEEWMQKIGNPHLDAPLTGPKPSLESRVDLIEKTMKKLLDRFESLDGAKSK
jgi:hypothetical protein